MALIFIYFYILALAVLAAIPITTVKEIIENFPLVAEKTVKVLSKYPKAAMYLLCLVLPIFPS